MCPEFLAHLARQHPPGFRHHMARVPGQSRTTFVITPDTDTDVSSDDSPLQRHLNPVASLMSLGFKYSDEAALNAALSLSSSAAAAASSSSSAGYFVEEPDPEPEPEGP